jgi:hypothetical protein
MQGEELSVKERAVLFALMGEAREVSNSELAERAGFRLDGKDRRRLNDRKVGRTYAHELTALTLCDQSRSGLNAQFRR